MIKANELRRGNLVDYTGSFLPIDSIAGDETVRLLVNGSSIGCFSTHLIDPIPLTPEILEKAGFSFGVHWNKLIGDVYLYNFGEKLNFNKETGKLNPVADNSKYIEVKLCPADIHLITISIKGEQTTFAKHCYLHTLQNLVHCITGKELELNDL